MQVLSQLSYNPTNRSTHRRDIGRHPGRSPGCSAGEFGDFRSPASTIPGSLRSAGSAYCSRVNAFDGEGTTSCFRDRPRGLG